MNIDENWLQWRSDLTELDIRDWLDWNIDFPPKYKHKDYEKTGIKIGKEVKFGIDLYYINFPPSIYKLKTIKYYIDGK